MGVGLSTAPAGRRVPSAALVLGGAGLLPVLATLLYLIVTRSPAVPASSRHLAVGYAAFGYSCLILSFLGGMWWGQASREPDRSGLYAMAVVPTLIAFALGLAAALLPASALPGIAVLLALAIVLTLPADALLVRRGVAPGWWMWLRVPLSLALGLGTAAIGLLL